MPPERYRTQGFTEVSVQPKSGLGLDLVAGQTHSRSLTVDSDKLLSLAHTRGKGMSLRLV